jgi:hypothetical protein
MNAGAAQPAPSDTTYKNVCTKELFQVFRVILLNQFGFHDCSGDAISIPQGAIEWNVIT